MFKHSLIACFGEMYITMYYKMSKQNSIFPFRNLGVKDALMALRIQYLCYNGDFNKSLFNAADALERKPTPA